MDPNWVVMLTAGSLACSLTVALVAARASLTGLLWAMARASQPGDKASR